MRQYALIKDDLPDIRFLNFLILKLSQERFQRTAIANIFDSSQGQVRSERTLLNRDVNIPQSILNG